MKGLWCAAPPRPTLIRVRSGNRTARCPWSVLWAADRPSARPTRSCRSSARTYYGSTRTPRPTRRTPRGPQTPASHLAALAPRRRCLRTHKDRRTQGLRSMSTGLWGWCHRFPIAGQKARYGLRRKRGPCRKWRFVLRLKQSPQASLPRDRNRPAHVGVWAAAVVECSGPCEGQSSRLPLRQKPCVKGVVGIFPRAVLRAVLVDPCHRVTRFDRQIGRRKGEVFDHHGVVRGVPISPRKRCDSRDCGGTMFLFLYETYALSHASLLGLVSTRLKFVTPSLELRTLRLL